MKNSNDAMHSTATSIWHDTSGLQESEEEDASRLRRSKTIEVGGGVVVVVRGDGGVVVGVRAVVVVEELQLHV
jgi:hypothetical protein